MGKATPNKYSSHKEFTLINLTVNDEPQEIKDTNFIVEALTTTYKDGITEFDIMLTDEIISRLETRDKFHLEMEGKVDDNYEKETYRCKLIIRGIVNYTIDDKLFFSRDSEESNVWDFIIYDQKNKFLTELKKFMLTNVKVKELRQIVGYYETIAQNQDDLSELINDCNLYDFSFRYEEDETQGYTQGKIIVNLYEKTDDEDEHYTWQEDVNHHYEIQLGYEDRYWGYCTCEPTHATYDPVHKCCGNGCDWSAPQISVQKIDNICYKGFEGVQRDVWELEKHWGKDEQHTKEEIERQNKLSQIKTLEEQIAALESKKNELHRELN